MNTSLCLCVAWPDSDALSRHSVDERALVEPEQWGFLWALLRRHREGSVSSDGTIHMTMPRSLVDAGVDRDVMNSLCVLALDPCQARRLEPSGLLSHATIHHLLRLMKLAAYMQARRLEETLEQVLGDRNLRFVLQHEHSVAAATEYMARLLRMVARHSDERSDLLVRLLGWTSAFVVRDRQGWRDFLVFDLGMHESDVDDTLCLRADAECLRLCDACAGCNAPLRLPNPGRYTFYADSPRKLALVFRGLVQEEQQQQVEICTLDTTGISETIVASVHGDYPTVSNVPSANAPRHIGPCPFCHRKDAALHIAFVGRRRARRA